MNKKNRLWRFTNEEARKYEVCAYENESYERFLDGNVVEMRKKLRFVGLKWEKGGWKLNSRALRALQWWFMMVEKFMIMALL